MSQMNYVYMKETLRMIKSVMYILIGWVKIVAKRKPYGYEQGGLSCKDLQLITLYLRVNWSVAEVCIFENYGFV